MTSEVSGDLIIQGTPLDLDQWTPELAAGYINASWHSAVMSIVETGRRLIETKGRLGHGNWLPTVSLLPFSERTAQALMSIASHPDLSNPQHVADLPASWGTLATLAQLPPGEIPKRIKAREITPELERSTAQGWAAIYQQAKQESLNAYSDAVDGLTKALSYAKTYDPPGDLPAGHVSIADFIGRAQELLGIVEQWDDQ